MQITHKFKHFFYDHLLLVSLLLLAVAFCVFANMESLRKDRNLTWAVGSVLAFTYFVWKQHLEEIRLFKELFTMFNDRYDEIKDRLDALYRSDKPLDGNEEIFLYGYFNLCAEEYLYYCKGFIYPEVWLAWYNGMKFFRKNKRIRDLWDKELGVTKPPTASAVGGSYYGFTIEDDNAS